MTESDKSRPHPLYGQKLDCASATKQNQELALVSPAVPTLEGFSPAMICPLGRSSQKASQDTPPRTPWAVIWLPLLDGYAARQLSSPQGVPILSAPRYKFGPALGRTVAQYETGPSCSVKKFLERRTTSAEVSRRVRACPESSRYETNTPKASKDGS
ncbi:hypothetical protein FGIG_04161 [Fasciola gigantica]|uniref:Uncharacterized protein n=1 Tax=Fasciola gigantica TaxID=46835 RepID=A0A504YLB2_FASGI|nr:hypothetical protein FGIG_04161 [Fasciola gigantica]